VDLQVLEHQQDINQLHIEQGLDMEQLNQAHCKELSSKAPQLNQGQLNMEAQLTQLIEE